MKLQEKLDIFLWRYGQKVTWTMPNQLGWVIVLLQEVSQLRPVFWV